MARWLAVFALLLSFSTGAAELKRWDGGALPAFELEDLQGRTHRLADYRGKVVMLDFWGLW